MSNDFFLATGSIFRTKDLNDQGYTNYKISKLVEEGVLKKIYQGVYALGDLKSLEIRDINVIVENGIVSLKSAAYYYKLLDGEEGKIEITLNRDHKPPKLPFDFFCYYYTTSKFFEIGLNVIDQQGKKLKIYDKERTVCDIIRHRSKYDNYTVSEIVSNYLKDENRNIEKLLNYAQELRIRTVVVQYLEVLGGIE